MKLSFVIPCYRSEKTVALVVDEIREVVKQRNYEYEIILVNDHSPDDVWSVIQKLAQEDSNVHGISFAKNFGQHSALLAGYARCSGDYVVSLDDDGQTPVDELYKLVEKLEEGFDVVYAYYTVIKRNAFRRFGTFMANKMGEFFIGQPKNMKGSSFYIARKFVIDEIIKYDRPYPYLAGLVFRTTKNVASVETTHRSRLQGNSGYSFKKLFSVWVNGFTAFSVKPLEMGLYAGMLIALLGFVGALFTIIRKIAGVNVLAGWSSTISVILFVGGIILVMLGLIGEYVGRIYICINNTPQYVIRDMANQKKDDGKKNDEKKNDEEI